jgi:mycothiol synthase
MAWEFRPLDLRAASELEYLQLSRFKNRIQAEAYPDDPAILLEEHIQEWKTLPIFMEVQAFFLPDKTGAEIVAYCEASVAHTGDNANIGDFTIEVLPEWRQQGLARKALTTLIPFFGAQERTRLTSRTCSSVPAGELFLERLHARKGLTYQMTQLLLDNMDKGLIDAWLAQNEQKKDRFATGFYEGPCPDELIESIAATRQVVLNDQPRENLDMEDMRITPQLLREIEQSMFASGNQRWTIYLRDQTTGQIAGLTEMLWNKNRPEIIGQGFTGVAPDYRNQGLGRWLKAAMLLKLSSDHPQGRFVRTGTAGTNAPMLKINNALGFQPYVSNTIWQMETQTVEQYLQERP